jgi:ABC-type multidrug transport system ATPase subunit
MHLAIPAAVLSVYFSLKEKVYDLTDENSDSPGPFVPATIGIFMLLALCVSAYFVMFTCVEEKRRQLLSVLRRLGLMESAYVMSWGVTSVVYAALVAAVLMITGHACDFRVFRSTGFGPMFMLLWLTGVAMHTAAIFVTSLFINPIAINLFVFASFITAIILELVFSIGFLTSSENEFQETWYARAWDDQYASSSPAGELFLFFVPFFHFGRALASIQQFTHYEGCASNEFVGWAQIHDSVKYYEIATCDGTRITDFVDIDSPEFSQLPPIYTRTLRPIGYSYGCLAANIVIYSILAWYFGQVLPGAGGSAQRFYFPFDPYFWRIWGRTTTTYLRGDTLGKERLESQEHQQYRLYKVSKAFKQNTALKEVTMQFAKGECTCVLGQNGAGKSTMVGIMSGLFNPTHGEGFWNGLSVNTDMEKIRENIGVCPQQDFMYEELSGWEHLWMYACFKGYSMTYATKVATTLLGAVRLTKHGQKLAVRYSGGMKRRLSVAISLVGNPSVVFLDEPSTGMDPLARRRLWTVLEDIKRDKRGRIMILNTHSMEEADALGDNVAILDNGRIRALGTPTYLKGRFGSGYQMSLLTGTDNTNSAVMKYVVQKCIPGSDVVSQSTTGVLLVGVPQSCRAIIGKFFRWLESDANTLVTEFGISNTTLEEVFLRLVAQSKEINSVATDMSLTRLPEPDEQIRTVLRWFDLPSGLDDTLIEQGISLEAVVKQGLASLLPTSSFPQELPALENGSSGGDSSSSNAANDGEDNDDAQFLRQVQAYIAECPATNSANLPAPPPGPVKGTLIMPMEVDENSGDSARNVVGTVVGTVLPSSMPVDSREMGLPEEYTSTVPNQVQGLMLKSLYNETHNPKSSICKIIFIVILTLFSLLFNSPELGVAEDDDGGGDINAVGLAMFIFSLVISILLPGLLSLLLIEKREGLRQFLVIMGMKEWVYWLSFSFYLALLQAVVFLLYVAINSVLGGTIFADTQPSIWFFLFLLIVVAQTGTNTSY